MLPWTWRAELRLAPALRLSSNKHSCRRPSHREKQPHNRVITPPAACVEPARRRNHAVRPLPSPSPLSSLRGFGEEATGRSWLYYELWAGSSEPFSPPLCFLTWMCQYNALHVLPLHLIPQSFCYGFSSTSPSKPKRLPSLLTHPPSDKPLPLPDHGTNLTFAKGHGARSA